MLQSKDDFAKLLKTEFDKILDDIEKVILTQNEEDIGSEVFKLEFKFISGQKFEDDSAKRVIKLIEHIIENNMQGSNQLINVFQRHWTKLSESSQAQVKELCERYKTNKQDLGTQVAMHEIIENRYLH